MPALPSLADVKTYLGLTGSGDDALLSALRGDAIAAAERDTGRTFASSSNITTTYSTNGQSSLVIHDRPLVDAGRTVTLNGTTMTTNTNVWFLPDRRDPTLTTTIQLRVYDMGRQDWYKSDPMWWDKNLDWRQWGPGYPNDLVITGILGPPFPPADVGWAVKFKWAALYWDAKAGASGMVTTPTGEPIDIEGESLRYQKFVAHWTIKTAVMSVG